MAAAEEEEDARREQWSNGCRGPIRTKDAAFALDGTEARDAIQTLAWMCACAPCAVKSADPIDVECVYLVTRVMYVW